MDLPAFIANISQDADPAQAGFQAHTIYVALNVCVPLALGALVAFVMGALEKLFGGDDGGGARQH